MISTLKFSILGNPEHTSSCYTL